MSKTPPKARRKAGTAKADGITWREIAPADVERLGAAAFADPAPATRRKARRKATKAAAVPKPTFQRSAPVRVRARDDAQPSRPKEYGPEVRQAVLDLMANGKSLRQIGRLPGMPDPSTVHGWVRECPDYAQAYRIATDLRAEALAEVGLAIAMAATPANAVASRLKLDGIKWFVGATSPRKWGPQQRVGLGGIGDDGELGLAPPTINIAFVPSGHRVGVDPAQPHPLGENKPGPAEPK